MRKAMLSIEKYLSLPQTEHKFQLLYVHLHCNKIKRKNMKKQLFCICWILLPLISLLPSCNEEEKPTSSPYEIYDVLMFVTNDANEDLVLNSNKYYHYDNTFRFDSWKIYLDGELIQTGDKANRYYEREVNYLQSTDVDRKNIRLDSSMEIQKRIDDYSEKHIAEYIVSSLSLFGDTKEHIIRMEFRKVENKYGYLALSEFTISVDDINQEVFYPNDWNDMTPKSQYKSIIFPYFILNVDAL